MGNDDKKKIKGLEWLEQEVNENGVEAHEIRGYELVIEVDRVNDLIDEVKLSRPITEADVESKSSLLQQIEFLQDAVGNPFNDLTAGMNIAYKNVKEVIERAEYEGERKTGTTDIGLPVIPKEVGERIEREINQFSLYRSLNYAYNYEGVGEDERRIDRWIVENTEEYAQAWLNGFTVEKHPKLLAKVKGWEQYVDFVGVVYWGTDDESGTDRLTFADRDQALAVTKKEWEQLGITEKNADFINHYE